MVCTEAGDTRRLAAQVLGIEYTITVVTYTLEHNLLNCATRNAYIRDAAMRVIVAQHGATNFLTTSGKQVLVDDVRHGEPGMYQDNPLAQISESTVRVTVIHSD